MSLLTQAWLSAKTGFLWHDLSMSFLDHPLGEADPQLAALIGEEVERQQTTLDLIASENYASRAVLECQGSALTNKYAEGYPGARYYAGCEVVDQVENLAIQRALQLFGSDHANVQPHSGASANAAAFQALLSPGDKLMGLDLQSGGHLTHGMKLNFSGQVYESSAYSVEEDGVLDMDRLNDLVLKEKPRLLIAGWSAYPRQLNFEAFRGIADQVGAYLLVDMSHFSGLVAGGVHPDPVPFADVVTSTSHKTLAGPRSGFILCRQEHAKAIDKAVFPGVQGGPLMHAVAGKALAFQVAMSEEFKERQRLTLQAAAQMASRLHDRPGLSVVSGKTEVHSFLLDLRQAGVDGRQGEERLEEVGVVVNRNAIPFDPAPPLRPSGIRLGSPALVSRGFNLQDFDRLADLIGDVLLGGDLGSARAQVAELCREHPLKAG